MSRQTQKPATKRCKRIRTARNLKHTFAWDGIQSKELINILSELDVLHGRPIRRARRP